MSKLDSGALKDLAALGDLELMPVWPEAPRFCTTCDLPQYRYAPWIYPRPLREELGYSHGEFDVFEEIDPDRWHKSEAYLFGIDLYHQGYLWESREQWQNLYKLARHDSPESNLLQALHLNSNAQLKAARGDASGTRTRSHSARWRLARIRAKGFSGPDRRFMGLDIADLIEQFQRHYSPVWELEGGERIPLEGDPPRLLPKR